MRAGAHIQRPRKTAHGVSPALGEGAEGSETGPGRRADRAGVQVFAQLTFEGASRDAGRRPLDGALHTSRRLDGKAKCRHSPLCLGLRASPPFSSLSWGLPQEAATALAQDLGGTQVSGQLGGPGRTGLGERIRTEAPKEVWEEESS